MFPYLCQKPIFMFVSESLFQCMCRKSLFLCLCRKVYFHTRLEKPMPVLESLFPRLSWKACFHVRVGKSVSTALLICPEI